MTVEHQYNFRGLLPGRLAAPMRDNVVANRGNIACLDSSGNALEGCAASGGAAICAGRFLAKYDNTVTGHVAGFVTAQIEIGVFEWDNSAVAGNVITAANIGQVCYVQDEHTVSLTSQGGKLIEAGLITDVPVKTDGSTVTGKIAVFQAPWVAKLASASREADQGALIARNVVTANIASLAAYTVAASATTNDNVLGVEGDLVLLVGQSTAAQNGLYRIGTVGGGTAPLTRAANMATGSILPNGEVVEISEGTLYGKGFFKATATTAGGAVIGTNDPAFFPRHVKKTVTLVAGAYTLGAGGGLEPLLLLAGATVHVCRNTANTVGSTVQYACITRTTGVAGTAAAVINAQVAAGTINVADISSVDVLITNC
jgi:hypothetical protein